MCLNQQLLAHFLKKHGLFNSREEDVTTTMYLRLAETYCEGGGVSDSREGGGVSDSCEGGGRNKVDSVCAAVRGALVSKGTNKYLLSIITTHVRETTPNLEAVLAILKDLKGIAVSTKH